MSTVVLLGPQRRAPTVATALKSLGVDGSLAVITAGWQEREGETEELADHLHLAVVELGLYRRAETLFEADPEFAAAHRARQARLQELQRLYRLRLAHTLEAARELLQAESTDAALLDGERHAALRTVRALDRHHLRCIGRIHEAFQDRWRPTERPALVEAREELSEHLAGCRALLIAGGHVGVLVSRLRLFDVAGLIGELPVVAWSAGAMALARSVVLFHDHPPQGPGDPEVLDRGLGLVEGIVPLPHAARRLRLDDPLRVGLFAGRFAPARCLTLDRGALVRYEDGVMVHVQHVGHLTVRGAVTEVESL